MIMRSRENPSAAASLMQIKVSATALRTHALVQLQKLAKSIRPGNARLDLIMLALKGNKIGFEKIIKMIDDLVATLKTVQKDDDDKKEYCSDQFNASDDKKKELEKAVSDLNATLNEIEWSATDWVSAHSHGQGQHSVLPCVHA